MSTHSSRVPGASAAARAAWAGRLQRWSERLRQAQVHGLIMVLLEAGAPLAPLGAQMLWIAQPALGLLVPRAEIGGLARILEAPDGLAWLQEQLAAPDEGEQMDGGA